MRMTRDVGLMTRTLEESAVPTLAGYAPPAAGSSGREADAQPGEPFSGFSIPEREALYADFQPLVRRLIRQYGEDPEMRQDLAGEIYCRFCDLLAAYDPSRGVPLRPYLVRTLTASVYTFTRSQWRRRHREVSLDPTASGQEAAASEDPSGAWDHELMTREVLRQLPNAIARLPKRQRQVVIWRYYESRSFDEIAEMLRIRPSTARSLLRHGINNLRRQIAGGDTGAE